MHFGNTLVVFSIVNYRSESFKFQVLKRSLFTNNFISAEINEKLKT